jgi:DegV family protein with EDD domain
MYAAAFYGRITMAIRILVDSACDLSQEQAQQLGVEVLPLRVTFGIEEYWDGVTLKPNDFFEKLVQEKDLPKTSQATPADYEQCFQQALEAGDEVLCITLSSKLSGCYQSACIALSECDQPEHIRVVDGLNATAGQQLLVHLALRLRQQGKTLGEIADTLETKRGDVRLLAVLDTLEYLKKGGRISSAVAFAGGLLAIKPVVGVVDGEVKLLGKARGTKKGMQCMTELMGEQGAIDAELPWVMMYSGTEDSQLTAFLQLYSDLLPSQEVTGIQIGSAIGTHVGPGAVGIAYFAKAQ